MNGHETDFYKRDVPQIRETLKKIGESLETIAHSLEVLAEIRIEDIARNHTELSDEDLFKDEESHIPFPDIQEVEDDINIPPYEDRPEPEWGELPDEGASLEDQAKHTNWEDEEISDDQANEDVLEELDEDDYDEDLDNEIRMYDANNN